MATSKWRFIGALLFGSSALAAPAWQAFGPSPQANGYYGTVPENVSGRCTSIAYSPNYDGAGTPALYLGTAGGGVWRTTDLTSATPTWTPLTDNLNADPSTEVGAIDTGSIAVDPLHPGTIYVGTGEANYSGDSRYGCGVLRSTNGGNTWTIRGNSTFKHQNISSIFVDPTDSTGNTIFASMTFGPEYADWGVYRSLNAGATWVNVSGTMTAPFGVSELLVSSMDYTVNSAGQLTIFAGSGSVFGDDIDGVWSSTDKGAHWTRITAGLPTGNTVGRITLAANHAAGSGVIYALIHDSFKVDPDSSTVYESVDNGVTWTPTADPGDFGGTWYQLAFCIGPPNQVYVAGLGKPFNDGGVRQSVDGGATWLPIDSGTNGVIPHTDHHALAYINGALYDANDGGIWRFHPKADGTAGVSVWDDLNTAGLQTIQIEGLTLHPFDPTIALEGSQDNGTSLRSAMYGNIWQTVSGGDGGLVRFDPGNGNIAYKVAPIGSFGPDEFFQRSNDGGHTWTGETSTIKNDDNFPGTEDEDDGPTAFPFYPTFTLDPVNGARVAIGSSRVYETKNRAAVWTDISGEFQSGQSVSAIAYAASAENTLYAGLGNGAVYRTDNDGTTAWTEVATGSQWGNSPVTGIAVDPTAPMTAYITVSAFTPTGRVWKTTDGGTTWTNISGTLPNVRADSIVLDPRTSPATLFVGTDLNVWKSTNGGSTWALAASGMPNAQVVDMQLDTYNNRLGAGTHGRGAWVLPFDVPGDVDGNGVVNAADVVLALQGAGGIVALDHNQTRRGDVIPGNGVGLDDATKILRLVFGL